jgi:hypothetical protein
MARWADLESSAPELAAAGRALLFHPGVGFGYLATIRADGGPRVHPIMPLIADGRLQAFLVPSPSWPTCAGTGGTRCTPPARLTSTTSST